MLKTILKIIGALVAVIALALGAFTVWGYIPVAEFEPAVYVPKPPAQWRTERWQRSTPEAQGMDCARLGEMMSAYAAARAEDDQLFIDSITIVRNGFIVADFYTNPRFPRDEMHIIHSATKSIVSALMGIAIDQGFIESVDVRVVDVFAGRTIKNLDENKRAMTIRDLLSMETGLHSRDSYLYAYEGLFAMQKSDDWLQYALDLPMVAKPGERFDYSNISTFLLAAIIMEATKTDPLAYARKNLFEPLGISEVKWEWNGNKKPIAWARMWLKPNDMAKIGLLYLQHGSWAGKQVVPAAWVRESVTPWAYPQNVVNILNADMSENGDVSNQNFIAQRFFRPFTDGYGYQWWLDREGAYMALGTNGQFIMVVPDKNLVVVFTSKSSGLATFFPAKLLRKHILPSIIADEPLPPSTAGEQRLREWAGPPMLGERITPVVPLPEIAEKVSGNVYAIQSNPFNTDNIRFVFSRGRDDAEISYTARTQWVVDYKIGLDGLHRNTETNDSTFAAVGKWVSSDTFVVDVEIIGYSSFDRWAFTFSGDEITVVEHSLSGVFTYKGRKAPPRPPGPEETNETGP